MEKVEEVKIVRTNKQSIFQKIAKIFWIFIIGSVLGYAIEMIVGLVQNGHFVSRQGLLIGPFIQVYGVGLVIYYLVISKIENKNNIKIFIVSMILGGLIEYLFSFFQEKLFGTISWDYRNLPLNINGRTSLLHCVYWGFGGILFVKYILPHLDKLDIGYKYKSFKIITALCMIFIIFDITISGLVGVRHLERRKNIKPEGKIDIFLDKYYPDSKLREIYSNAKEVVIDEF